MQPNSTKYHTTLANYFSAQPHFFDGDQQKKPHIRKCMEQPFQQTKAHLWDEVTDTLCNLEFIQAKACAKMTYDLVKDFNNVLQVIPDNAENIREEIERQARMDKYTRDLIAYSKGEITELEVPETAPLWNEEKIKTEIERMKTNPTRLDRLKDFKNFLGQEADNLQNYSPVFPYYVTQQAWNYADIGPVGYMAEKAPSEFLNRLMLRSTPTRPLWNPFPQVEKMLKAHIGSVNAVAITPDGKRAISGSDDKICIIWDLNTGQAIHNLTGHTKSVNAVDITLDGQRAISGSDDKTCILWDLNTGQALMTLKGHTNYIRAVSITPDGGRAISSSYNGTCILWNLNTGETIKTLEGHNRFATAVAITPDGKRAISVSDDKTCVIWDLNIGQVINTLEGHTTQIVAVAITPDGKRAFSSSRDFNCIIWDLNTGQAINSLVRNIFWVNAVAITPDHKRAISCLSEDICVIWDTSTGQVINTLKGHTKNVNAIAITPDGRRAFSGSDDHTCIVWNLNATQQNTPMWYTNEVHAFAITPDGKRAISGVHDYSWITWNLATGHVINTLKCHYGTACVVVITPDGKRALSGSNDETCIFWDLNTGQPVTTLKGKDDSDVAYLTTTIEGKSAVAITPDGKRAISSSEDHTCIIWDLNTGQAINTLKGHTHWVNAVAITPDGKRAISCSWDKTWILWDLNKGRAINTLIGHSDQVNAIAITPDGRRAISGSWDNTCIIWDLNTGQPIITLKGHTDRVSAVAITPDGRRAISGSWDNTCIIWDIESKEKVGIFITTSHINMILCFPSCIFGREDSLKIFLFNLNNELLCTQRSIVTIRQIWDFELQQYLPLSADCPLCGHRFAPPASVLDSIDIITKKAGLRPEQSPCLELPDESWEEPGLLGNCPKCKGELKFNPFVAGGDN